MIKRLIQLIRGMIQGPKSWNSISNSERQAIMVSSEKDAKKLRGKSNNSRVDTGAMLPAEGSYTNSSNREQFVGAGDSALARSLAEERAKAIEQSQRNK